MGLVKVVDKSKKNGGYTLFLLSTVHLELLS